VQKNVNWTHCETKRFDVAPSVDGAGGFEYFNWYRKYRIVVHDVRGRDGGGGGGSEGCALKCVSVGNIKYEGFGGGKVTLKGYSR
jgi:hypothetical protein